MRLVIVASLLFCGCAVRRPTSNTAAPSLGSAREINRSVQSDIVDAKDSIGRAQGSNARLKASLELLDNKDR
jgi:hypothetical protein